MPPALGWVVNYALYQTGWFAGVFGAGAGRPWLGTLACASLLGGHLVLSRRRLDECILAASVCAFGLLIGALARETRTALLAALMITLPLAVIALIPGNDIAYWVSAVAGFGPAARVFQQLLVDPEVTSSLWTGLGLLAAIALVPLLSKGLRAA